jgi:3-oxoacyl-[acyl-carrier-protein] synthase-3
MAFIQAFGRYVPERVLGNAELSERLGCDAAWILEASGIEQRRIAEPGETVAMMAERAARVCMHRPVGLVIMSSGTSERRFPGPAAHVAERLGVTGVPAIDLPLASAGSLFGMALAAQLAPAYGAVLVVAAEKMSAVSLQEKPLDRNTAILFGDGAGACLVTSEPGPLEIVDTVLHSDGAYAESLRLELSGPIQMDGRTVIMQASRKIPSAIAEVLSRQGVEAGQVQAFLLHQANRNLIERIAKALGVPAPRFFSNIGKYGNTSSASMLIAASEWWDGAGLNSGEPVCFAAFGAGFHWGALLARKY